jgi:hypothetical protein
MAIIPVGGGASSNPDIVNAMGVGDLPYCELDIPISLGTWFILPRDTERTLITLFPANFTEVYYATPFGYSASVGFPVGPGTSPIILTTDLHGAIVQSEWYLVTGTDGGRLGVGAARAATADPVPVIRSGESPAAAIAESDPNDLQSLIRERLRLSWPRPFSLKQSPLNSGRSN